MSARLAESFLLNHSENVVARWYWSWYFTCKIGVDDEGKDDWGIKAFCVWRMEQRQWGFKAFACGGWEERQWGMEALCLYEIQKNGAKEDGWDRR